MVYECILLSFSFLCCGHFCPMTWTYENTNTLYCNILRNIRDYCLMMYSGRVASQWPVINPPLTRQMTTPSLLHKPVIASLRVIFNVIWPLFGATDTRYQGGFGFNESSRRKTSLGGIGKHGLCCCIWLRCWYLANGEFFNVSNFTNAFYRQ